ncbi:MAG TPA: substrate-binding domain-containing protein [Candidatus Elarobacter sp.]|jgi:phosphate transport system substrate-binding protein|nr:substrate-binding domain-containing protein [Candidatus Elarobacter sp.]
MNRSLFVLSALAAAPATVLAPRYASAQSTTEEDVKKSFQAQAERAGVVYERGRQPHYTQKFDLSGLPQFSPKEQLSGWIRIHGSNYLADGMLGEYWEKGFQKYQPGVKISYYLPTSAAAFAALYYNQADLIVAHTPGFYDLLAYQRVMGYDPTEITAATGSYDVAGWENSTVILVNKDSPLKGISLKQIDGVFGAAREGGWAGTNFRPDWKRGPEGNIRRWGQLGIAGAWADKPIDVYGFNLRYSTAVEFSNKFLRASDKWNENIHAFAHIVQPNGKRYIEADQITDALARNPYGIAYNRYRGDRAGTRRVPVAATEGGPYVEHTIENVQNRSYPLFSEAFFYANVKPGTKMNPMVKEFLRYILSREGQNEVQRDGKYLPLTAAVAREQLKKLEVL